MPKASHGMTNSPTYKSWQMMKVRCYDHKHISYPNYGGRGIKVDQRWLQSFEHFLNDMGERPNGTSLDRIDSDKGYYKSNCRWSTRREQALNKRTSRTGVTKNGKRWRAVIKLVDQKSIHVGYFDSYEEALAARIEKESSYNKID